MEMISGFAKLSCRKRSLEEVSWFAKISIRKGFRVYKSYSEKRGQDLQSCTEGKVVWVSQIIIKYQGYHSDVSSVQKKYILIFGRDREGPLIGPKFYKLSPLTFLIFSAENIIFLRKFSHLVPQIHGQHFSPDAADTWQTFPN